MHNRPIRQDDHEENQNSKSGKGRKGKKRKAAKGKPPDPLTQASLEAVLGYLGVAGDWDVVLVGDGSGSSWQHGCGWSCVLVDKVKKSRRLFYGAMSCGGNNVSELLPYLQALLWFEDSRGKIARKKANRKLRVHIITDSKHAAMAGNRAISRRTNLAIWAALDSVANKGYQVVWHWLGRDRAELNKLTDQLSRDTRRTLNHVPLPGGDTVNGSNPSK